MLRNTRVSFEASSRLPSTTSHSQLGQNLALAYTLSFNMQFLQTICRIMRSYLQKAQGVMPGEMETSTSRISQLYGISPGADTVLRVLRLYCCWLSSHAEDLAQAPEAIQFIVQSAWKDFAQMATDLLTYSISDIQEFSKQNDLPFPPTAPYLMKEDEEAVCCLSIGDLTSPVYTRLFHYGTESRRKPTILEFGAQGVKPLDEFVCRLGDFVGAVQHFAESPALPLGIQTTSDGQWSLVYGYQAAAESWNQPAPESQSQPPVQPSSLHLEVTHAAVPTVETYHSPQQPTGVIHHDVTSFSGMQDGQGPALSPRSPVGSTAAAMRGGTYSPLSWDWFYEPKPTGAWTGLTREVFESLPTESAPASRRASSAVGTDNDHQREMLLRMLRSASQGTGKESPSFGPAVSPRAQEHRTLHPGQASDYLFPQASPSYPSGASIDMVAALGVTSPLPDLATTEQPGSYMLHNQNQVQQPQQPQQQLRRGSHVNRAPLSQQVQQQMAAMQNLDPQGGSRPRSSRGNGAARGPRNQGDGGRHDASRLLDLRKKTVNRIPRGINGP